MGEGSDGFWKELLSFETPGGALRPALLKSDGLTVVALR